MTPIIPIFAALWLASPAAATPQAPPAGFHVTPDAPADLVQKEDVRFDGVASLLSAGKPDQAIAILDSIIADQEKAHRGESRQIFCARSMAETMRYATMSAKALKGAKGDTQILVLGPDWSLAIFLKGFALVDLHRPAEAKPLFDRAVALSPMNAQFLAELGEWHKNRREWNEAYSLFERARAAAELSPEDMRSHDLRRGMRGMGFVLIEQGKLDEAAALFRKVLEIDPADSGARSELQYIEDQKAKPPRTT